MNVIDLPLWADNRIGQGKNLTQACKEVLKTYSGIPIGELKAKNSRLILFPPAPAKGFPGDFQQQHLFRLNEEGFDTTNVMGVISLPNDSDEGRVILSVGSRFDLRTDHTLHPNQPFLTYLLAQSLDWQFSDWNIKTSRGHLWDFLLALVWASYLKYAFRKGLLKLYVNRSANDPQFQGALDVSRFITQNVPFLGKVAHRYREHTSDNPVLHLIRAAGDHVRILLGDLWRFVISDPDVRQAFCSIEENTPSYERQGLRRLLAQARPVRHPYYSEYEDLRNLSIRLLLGEGEALYGDKRSDGEVYGVLFDGSWLWERFLAKALAPAGFRHCLDNEVGFVRGRTRFRPDFLMGHRNDASWILDAKYKNWDSHRNREDIHQVLSYMYLTGATHGGVIFPRPTVASEKEGILHLDPKELLSPRRHSGVLKEYWYEIGVPIPQGLADVSAIHKRMKFLLNDLSNAFAIHYHYCPVIS